MTYQELIEKHNLKFKAEEITTRPDGLMLDCLASDASSYENAKDFANWASEYGYDTDSRKAEKGSGLTAALPEFADVQAELSKIGHGESFTSWMLRWLDAH